MNKLTLASLAFAGSSIICAYASAGMEGVYVSKEQCKLKVETLSQDAGYADGTYKLRSDGTGACEWTGVGVAKRTVIDAGIISGSSRAFAEMNWKFGPEGNQVEITFYDTDGTKRYTATYEKEMQTAGK